MSKRDLVSIITPAYNCGLFITETIHSVLAQTYTNWEMIIVDDCSTDGTENIVSLFLTDDRFRYIKNLSCKGAAVSRNIALKEAKGRWIAFLDSDDLWMPDKLEKQILFMKENGYAFSYHDYIEIDEQSKEIGRYVSGMRFITKWEMYGCCWPGCLSVMYDASIIGVIQIADVKKNNDTAMWLKIIEKSNCYLLKENLGQYRRRTNSITPTSIQAKIGWHYILFRDAAGMNPLSASFWMCINVFGNSLKKMFYVRKYDVNQ